MVLKAVYQDGVFKPIMPVDLADGEWVELEIVRSRRLGGGKIVSLQGVWKEYLRPEDRGDWVSETIAEIRRGSTEKLQRLARELGENPTGER
jgi:predicted DNA-binding antitoxin AbrB/MazE fold protein